VEKSRVAGGIAPKRLGIHQQRHLSIYLYASPSLDIFAISYYSVCSSTSCPFSVAPSRRRRGWVGLRRLLLALRGFQRASAECCVQNHHRRRFRMSE
jgi:hypothetical protein